MSPFPGRILSLEWPLLMSSDIQKPQDDWFRLSFLRYLQESVSHAFSPPSLVHPIWLVRALQALVIHRSKAIVLSNVL